VHGSGDPSLRVSVGLLITGNEDDLIYSKSFCIVLVTPFHAMEDFLESFFQLRQFLRVISALRIPVFFAVLRTFDFVKFILHLLPFDLENERLRSNTDLPDLDNTHVLNQYFQLW